jgi:hypothetical protein
MTFTFGGVVQGKTPQKTAGVWQPRAPAGKFLSVASGHATPRFNGGERGGVDAPCSRSPLHYEGACQ